MKRANLQDMNMMLDGMLMPGDMYNVKVFTQVMPTSPMYYFSFTGGALGALLGGLFEDEFGSARIHTAYLGFTNYVMNFAVLDDWHIDKLATTRTYNLSEITKVKYSDKLISFQAKIWFGKKKIKISIPKKVVKSDITQQKECVEAIKNYFEQLSAMLKERKKAA